MSTVSIPMLPQAIALTGAEQMEAVQSGTSVRLTAAQVAALGGPTGPTGPTGPSGGPTGPTGPAGPSSLTGVLTANLPAAASAGAGALAFVTDSTVTTFYTIVVGGGANCVPVFCDGVAWRVG
jgi:hypothetical protein